MNYTAEHVLAPGDGGRKSKRGGDDGGAKRLEHAPPGEPWERPSLVVAANNIDVAPGAFHVQQDRNTVPSSTSSAPSLHSYDSSRGLATKPSAAQEVGVPHSFTEAGARAPERDLHAVEAQLVQEEAMMVAEARPIQDESTRMKWYRRPLYRWIFVGSILLACSLIVAVIVLVVRPHAGVSSSALGAPPTLAPLTAEEQIACNFLSRTDLMACRSTVIYDGTTTGSIIPTELGLLTQLTYLDFGDNQLTSSIPSELGLLSQLTTLYLAFNQLTSSIPTELGLLKKLTKFCIDNNQLTSSLPTELGLLNQLTVLALFNNQLTSSIPTEIGLLTQLTSVYFSDNQLAGTIPSSLCSLASIDIFIDCSEITCASGCCNSGTSPYGSCGSTSASPTLDPTTAPTTASAEQIACNFLSLKDLLTCRSTVIYNGTTTGSTIPTELGLLTQLTYLDFGDNQLTSSIPSELGLLTQLTTLYLAFNQLTSSVPTELGLLTQLTKFSIDNNQLTSSIPTELGLLTQLTVLAFFNNQLTSSIPTELGLLTQLTSLYFYINQLAGTIPSSLCSLASIDIFIDCGEITCASGCCRSGADGSLCG